MAQPQKGICAEPNLQSLYLMFNVIDEELSVLRNKLADVLALFDYMDQEHYEAMLSGVIGVGANFWSDLYPQQRPKLLTAFPDFAHKEPRMPVLPCDLFIQLRADRGDVCHQLGVEVCRILGPHTELVEQLKGFRYLDGRDLTGFATAYDNPRGMAKFDVALVGEEDEAFQGGSYLHVQRYQHNLSQWNTLSQAQQEYIMGRSKEDNRPLEPSDCAPACHAVRIQVDRFGKPIKLLRQSMPYGDMLEQGLYFVSFCRSPEPFTRLLENLLMADKQGRYDLLLDYTSAQTGAAFFAPSIDFIRQQAKS